MGVAGAAGSPRARHGWAADALGVPSSTVLPVNCVWLSVSGPGQGLAAGASRLLLLSCEVNRRGCRLCCPPTPRGRRTR